MPVSKHWLLSSAALAVCSLFSAPQLLAQTLTGFPTVPLPAFRQFTDCTPSTPASSACRVAVVPSESELELPPPNRKSSIWLRGDTLAFLYKPDQSNVQSVDVGGGIQLPMSRVVDSSTWLLRIKVPNASKAVVDVEFWINTADTFIRDTMSVKAWRGPHAPAVPLRAAALRGTVRIDSLWSPALQQWRSITSYLPPKATTNMYVVYLADGQNVQTLAPLVDTLVTTGQLPPIALIGIWTATDRGHTGTPADDMRSVEYVPGAEFIPGVDSGSVVNRRRAHEAFFTSQVREWAEQSFAVSTARDHRAVYGSSNAGLFAMRMAQQHPEVYGAVIANSHGNAALLTPPETGWPTAARHFLSIGVLEQATIRQTLRQLSDSLNTYGVKHQLNIYPSGHDSLMWEELFPRALKWWTERVTPDRSSRLLLIQS